MTELLEWKQATLNVVEVQRPENQHGTTCDEWAPKVKNLWGDFAFLGKSDPITVAGALGQWLKGIHGALDKWSYVIPLRTRVRAAGQGLQSGLNQG